MANPVMVRDELPALKWRNGQSSSHGPGIFHISLDIHNGSPSFLELLGGETITSSVHMRTF